MVSHLEHLLETANGWVESGSGWVNWVVGQKWVQVKTGHFMWVRNMLVWLVFFA